MHRILRLVRREYKSSVKTKGFIIGLILAPIFMGGGLIAIVLLKDRVDTTDKRIAIIDRSSVIADVRASHCRVTAHHLSPSSSVRPINLT